MEGSFRLAAQGPHLLTRKLLTSLPPRSASTAGRLLIIMKILEMWGLLTRHKKCWHWIGGGPAWGDVMKCRVQVDGKEKTVVARFKTFGCGSASASSLLDTGTTMEETLTIKNTQSPRKFASSTPVKLHCSMLTEDAIKAALADYKLKQEPKKEVGKKT